jgi:hypothetical protein
MYAVDEEVVCRWMKSGLDGGRLRVIGVFSGVVNKHVSGGLKLWDIEVNQGFCIE